MDIANKIDAEKKIKAENRNFEQKADSVNNINYLHKAVERLKIIMRRITLAMILNRLWGKYGPQQNLPNKAIQPTANRCG